MDITYRTLGPWGPGKGANLQPSEVDGNFWSVAQAIVDLQENPALPNGIASITVSGTQMTIYLNDGTVMGPFTLPVLTFRWRGVWEPGTSYAVLDVFTVYQVGIYMVQVSHISGSTFDPSLVVGDTAAYLQLFGSADASLAGLSDVLILNVRDHNIIEWNANDQRWENLEPGDMLYQWSFGVQITGGSITGMPTPVNPTDVATKAYVDAAPVGSDVAAHTMLANVNPAPAPAFAVSLSDYLDAALGTTVRGTFIYRGAAGWVSLSPGPSGYFLQTLGAGNDPVWEVGSAGVTSITAGVGLSTGGAPITRTGSIALAAIAPYTMLANASTSTTPPIATTVTQYLDAAIGGAQGSIITRTAAGWSPLAPGTSGFFLKTLGAAGVMWDAPAGSGTVTSVTAGHGLRNYLNPGSAITGIGTLSLDLIPSPTVLGFVGGGDPSWPVPVTTTELLDAAVSSTQGSVLYRSASTWVALAPGTIGQILTTGGSAANPSWQNAPVTGSSVPNLRIVANVSGSTAVPTGQTLSDILDAILSSARGSLMYRGNAGWVALAPGTTGQVLQTGGATGDPSWISNSGGSIAIASPQAQDTLSYNSSSGKFENVRPRYNLGAYVPGLMTASQNLLYHKFPKAVTLPANLGTYLGQSTVAGVAAAPTGSLAITLARAPAASPTVFTTVATITIASAAFSATMSTQGAITFAVGEVLRVRAPASANATAADFFMTLVGFET